MIKTLRVWSVFMLVVIGGIVLVACGNNEATEDTKKNVGKLSIGTYQPGIGHHFVASGLADVLTKETDFSVTVRPFGGPKAWYPLMEKGDIDIGTTDYTVNWAVQGINGNEGELDNIRTLVIGNEINIVGYAVREDSGIDSVKDLKGKKVAFYTASPESFNPTLELQLKSAGLTWDDVEKVSVTDIGQGIEALREGRVDAAFTGDPNLGLFLETDTAIGIKGLNLADISPDEFDQFPMELFEESDIPFSPGLEPDVAKGGFLDEETVVFKEPMLAVVGTHMSEDDVYEVVKGLFENYEELHPIHKWLEGWTPEKMFREDPPVPYHDGAIKYFKEIDIWTDEAQENHDELLKIIE